MDSITTVHAVKWCEVIVTRFAKTLLNMYVPHPVSHYLSNALLVLNEFRLQLDNLLLISLKRFVLLVTISLHPVRRIVVKFQSLANRLHHFLTTSTLTISHLAKLDIIYDTSRTSY